MQTHMDIKIDRINGSWKCGKLLTYLKTVEGEVQFLQLLELSQARNLTKNFSNEKRERKQRGMDWMCTSERALWVKVADVTKEQRSDSEREKQRDRNVNLVAFASERRSFSMRRSAGVAAERRSSKPYRNGRRNNKPERNFRKTDRSLLWTRIRVFKRWAGKDLGLGPKRGRNRKNPDESLKTRMEKSKPG